MGRPTDNERKDVSHPFMTMILTCVTMVGWTDVPDSDRGDFRRQRAVDVSSFAILHRAWRILPCSMQNFKTIGRLKYVMDKRDFARFEFKMSFSTPDF